MKKAKLVVLILSMASAHAAQASDCSDLQRLVKESRTGWNKVGKPVRLFGGECDYVMQDGADGKKVVSGFACSWRHPYAYSTGELGDEFYRMTSQVSACLHTEPETGVEQNPQGNTTRSQYMDENGRKVLNVEKIVSRSGDFPKQIHLNIQ